MDNSTKKCYKCLRYGHSEADCKNLSFCILCLKDGRGWNHQMFKKKHCSDKLIYMEKTICQNSFLYHGADDFIEKMVDLDIEVLMNIVRTEYPKSVKGFFNALVNKF